MTSQNLLLGGEAGNWDQAVYAFLAEKERRSGSMRTVRANSGMLCWFFDKLGKPPGQVTAPEVFGYAHGAGHFGNKHSSATINARTAWPSSLYRFLIRMNLIKANHLRSVGASKSDSRASPRVRPPPT